MNNPFKRHRFPARIFLLAVRWYCRYPLSYRDVQDMLAERNIHVSRSTINRWVVKFGPEIAHKIRALHSPRTMQWHVDETYIRVSGRWRYIKHNDSKWYNNCIESDHASLKRITDPGKGFRSLRTAKATLHGVEAFRSIKQGHLRESTLNAAAEIQLVNRLFAL